MFCCTEFWSNKVVDEVQPTDLGWTKNSFNSITVFWLYRCDLGGFCCAAVRSAQFSCVCVGQAHFLTYETDMRIFSKESGENMRREKRRRREVKEETHTKEPADIGRILILIFWNFRFHSRIMCWHKHVNLTKNDKNSVSPKKCILIRVESLLKWLDQYGTWKLSIVTQNNGLWYFY